MACNYMKEIPEITSAPKPIGPYSVAVMTDNLVFCSGQLGIDPKTGALVEGGIEAQTRQACENIKNILEESASCLKCAVKTTVFLKDINDFGKMNAVYSEYFGEESPARSAFQVAALPKDGLVEIEVVAMLHFEDCECGCEDDDCDGSCCQE